MLLECGELDVILLLDYSGSITEDFFDKTKFAAETIVDVYFTDQTRMGAIGFGTNATTYFTLDEYNNKEDIIDAINSEVQWIDWRQMTNMGNLDSSVY